MEPQEKSKKTQDSCKEPCKGPCKEPYVLTQEDMRTMRTLTYQLGKLNESLKKFGEMAENGGLFSSFFQ